VRDDPLPQLLQRPRIVLGRQFHQGRLDLLGVLGSGSRPEGLDHLGHHAGVVRAQLAGGECLCRDGVNRPQRLAAHRSPLTEPGHPHRLRLRGTARHGQLDLDQIRQSAQAE